MLPGGHCPSLQPMRREFCVGGRGGGCERTPLLRSAPQDFGLPQSVSAMPGPAARTPAGRPAHSSPSAAAAGFSLAAARVLADAAEAGRAAGGQVRPRLCPRLYDAVEHPRSSVSAGPGPPVPRLRCAAPGLPARGGARSVRSRRCSWTAAPAPPVPRRRASVRPVTARPGVTRCLFPSVWSEARGRGPFRAGWPRGGALLVGRPLPAPPPQLRHRHRSSPASGQAPARGSRCQGRCPDRPWVFQGRVSVARRTPQPPGGGGWGGASGAGDAA